MTLQNYDLYRDLNGTMTLIKYKSTDEINRFNRNGFFKHWDDLIVHISSDFLESMEITSISNMNYVCWVNLLFSVFTQNLRNNRDDTLDKFLNGVQLVCIQRFLYLRLIDQTKLKKSGYPTIYSLEEREKIKSYLFQREVRYKQLRSWLEFESSIIFSTKKTVTLSAPL